MILIEVLQAVVEVDGRLHVFLDRECNIALLINRTDIVILYSIFQNLDGVDVMRDKKKRGEISR
jgi:hypothetical protein